MLNVKPWNAYNLRLAAYSQVLINLRNQTSFAFSLTS